MDEASTIQMLKSLNALNMGKKISIGILTSGGDSPGMNAAVRAVVRMAIYQNCTPYAIYEGYQGLVNGGEYIRELTWNDVAQIISIGGTTIGTARCAAFRERAGRLAAARNMVARGINSLVVIGGDGSLTGAELLRQEWPSLMKELQLEKEKEIEHRNSSDTNEHNSTVHFEKLYIAGLVGSIDNDMCGTEWTIGADTSLHRILEAIDAISTSAISHQRIFIIEVMGRHCGWLALMAAVSCGADWCFIPEVPTAVHGKYHLTGDLAQSSNTSGAECQLKAMCAALQHNRTTLGRRLSVVIVSEGAVDIEGQPITSKDVQQAIFCHLQQEARITVLGHLQRGGSPSAYDRILATLQGIEAVKVILEAALNDSLTSTNGMTEPQSSSVLIGVRENKICRLDLTECVQRTRSVGDAYATRDFEKVFHLRDPDFKAIYRHYHSYLSSVASKFCSSLSPTQSIVGEPRSVLSIPEKVRLIRKRRVAIMCVGAPAGGMNACIAAIVRACLLQGDLTPIGILEGLPTLLKRQDKMMNSPDAARASLIKEFTWMDVDGWISKGGTLLGTHRSLLTSTDQALEVWNSLLNDEDICADALILIGGYEAFLTTRTLDAAYNLLQENGVILKEPTSTNKYPIICVPATISNNVPGTEFSLGSDTALNIITQSCDIIRLSAASTKRVFCVEVQGGRCGYLAQMGAIASAATYSYLPEEGITLANIARECTHLKERFSDDKKDGRLVLVNEHASAVFQAESIAKIFQSEGKPLFDARSCKLGHLQQGGAPSPRDRILGLRYGKMAVDYITAFFKGVESTSDAEQAALFKDAKARRYSLDPYDATFLPIAAERAVLVGIQNGAITFSNVHHLAKSADDARRVSKYPWWLEYRPYAKVLSKYST